MHLEMTCDKCLVSQTCPKYGASPTIQSKKRFTCKIIGGYGRNPIDESILSEETKETIAKNGPCLTIAEVPVIQEDESIYFETVKIFSQAILSKHERTNIPLDSMYPKSHVVR